MGRKDEDSPGGRGVSHPPLGRVASDLVIEEVDSAEVQPIRAGGEEVGPDGVPQAPPTPHVNPDLDALDSPTRSLRPREGLEPPPRDRRIGELLLGKYRIDKLIGKGGMGRVYLGVQYPLNRAVAVKVLNPEFQRKDPQFVRRFFLEAATAARLNHPNTITVFDYGETERGELFIAMEYLNGRPLSRVLSSEGPFAGERTIYVSMQIARALREAHAKGIIHRDLKPGNIMLLEEGDDADFVKVLDFGLVKLFNPGGPGDAHPLGPLTPSPLAGMEGEVTRAGMFLGSPKYMSPEQIQGHDLDVRTDIYSLGVIMYQMLAGRPPFRGSTSVEIIYKHVNEQVPPIHHVHPEADAPPELERVILRCLSKAREDRYPSMGDLLQSLKEVRRAITGVGSVTGSGGMFSDPPQRRDVTDSVAAAQPGSRSSSLPPAPLHATRGGSLPPVRAYSVPVAPPIPSRPTPSVPPRLESSFLDRAVVSDDTVAGVRGGLIARALPIVGGAILVLSLGTAAYYLSSERVDREMPAPAVAGEPPAPATDPSPAAQPAPAAPAPAPSRDKLEARVTFSSNPEGAEVFEGDRSIGKTPFEHVIPRGEDQPDTRRFVFKKAGFHDEPLTERIDGDRLKIHASLRAVATAPPAQPAPQPAKIEPRKPPPSSKPKPPKESSEYKENPY